MTAPRRGLRARLAACVIGCLTLGGCASYSLDLGYYWQSMSGQWALMRAARPIPEVIADPATDPAVRSQLEKIEAIRAFASRELGLPDNASYTRYADLGRPYALWNVFAAPELSLRLRQWCFPFAGCVSYRGYFHQADADRFGAELRGEGTDVYVAGIAAYSTLGWFSDPVLNTFIRYPEPELARLIFHELAHQTVYLKGDSTFNESYAVAVEEAGVRRWLARRGDPALDRQYALYVQRREAFVALLTETRDELDALYRSDQDDAAKRAGKAAAFARLLERYGGLKAQWGGWGGYDRWFSRTLGNAQLGSVSTYTELVPGFRRLLEQNGGDLPRFHQAVRELASKGKEERLRILGP